jgi:hypothetical protein
MGEKSYTIVSQRRVNGPPLTVNIKQFLKYENVRCPECGYIGRLFLGAEALAMSTGRLIYKPQEITIACENKHETRCTLPINGSLKVLKDYVDKLEAPIGIWDEYQPQVLSSEETIPTKVAEKKEKKSIQGIMERYYRSENFI